MQTSVNLVEPTNANYLIANIGFDTAENGLPKIRPHPIKTARETKAFSAISITLMTPKIESWAGSNAGTVSDMIARIWPQRFAT